MPSQGMVTGKVGVVTMQVGLYAVCCVLVVIYPSERLNLHNVSLLLHQTLSKCRHLHDFTGVFRLTIRLHTTLALP